MNLTMFKSKAKKLLVAVTILVSSVALVSPLMAQSDTGGSLEGGNLGICTFIGPICTALGLDVVPAEDSGGVALNFATERVGQVVSLIFIGIIIISVFIIVQAGVKYIQSQGDEGKIEEAQKAIRSVFIGIAILFVGIIGIVLVLAFFGGTGLLGTNTSLDDLFNTDDELRQCLDNCAPGDTACEQQCRRIN